ncbi:urease accessory protein UreF [Alteromonas sp. a30]|nr:urease accessory protein UreF [Alteromonas sp. a30]
MSTAMTTKANVRSSVDTNAMLPSLKLNRLLQLCSANLPIGGFSFSQGMEYAVEQGWITDVSSCKSWILTLLYESIASTDLPILGRAFHAIEQQQLTELRYWNEHLLACRESKEMYFADVAMGKALMRLLRQLEGVDETPFTNAFEQPNVSFVAAFACAAWLWQLDISSTQSGFCWTVIDSQVAAATKLVPLGQTQAQQLLFDLSEQVAPVIESANRLSDDELGNSLPRLAMASAWHETQYSRLFRS